MRGVGQKDDLENAERVGGKEERETVCVCVCERELCVHHHV